MWNEVLENVFADEVSGIYCVLETEDEVYTYYVDHGVAVLRYASVSSCSIRLSL